jgi:hypothetical protein
MPAFRRTFVFLVLVSILGFSSYAMAQAGPPGGTIYAHDREFKTVGTPTSLPDHGKFDTIYVLGEGFDNVADAAPGDMEFNGGRWEVRPIMWTNSSPEQFTNAEQVKDAEMNGEIEIGDVIKRFECPMIPKH